MLKKIILFLFMHLCLLSAGAQEIEKILISAGEDVNEVLASAGMYRFPAFANGTVFFRNGNRADGKMNYNIYLRMIQFIDPKGDTLAISNPETTDSISIGGNLFFYEKKGYLQVVASSPGCSLAMRQIIAFNQVKTGAFGTHQPGTSTQGYESVSTQYVVNSKLVLNEDVTVIKTTSYMLLYKKYRQETADRQGFLAAFPERKNEIEYFIRANKINFKKLDDLKKLMAFCSAQQ